MKILGNVGVALQRLFRNVAAAAGDESGVIERVRKFDAVSLAQTFVWGFLRDPRASDEKLAQMAAQCGAAVTPQAIEQRQTSKLVDFLQKLFAGATKLVVGSSQALAPILERFPSVTLLDSSTITLPDELQEQFRGCGGSYGGGAAAMKLQAELDLRSGALTCVEVEPGRRPDGASNRQQARHGKGSLRISDLGYFNVVVFAALAEAGEYFLSRLQFGTNVLLGEGNAVDVLGWLAKQRGFWVDRPIQLGQVQRLNCRLIAWRLPAEQANRRRRKLRQDMQSKHGCEPSAERLAWCDWTILVSNVPAALLTPKEAAVLYRARWQVELLFKRWKSQGLVAELSGSSVVRQMVRVWSRLLAVVVQHWLVITFIWGNPSKSLSKAYEAVRDFASRLAATIGHQVGLDAVLKDLRQTLEKTCQRNRRNQPGTYELLNEVDLLDYDLKP